MKLSSIPCLLVLVASAQATVFAVVSDPNACVQNDYARVISFPIPAPDVNEPYGAILGPVSGDPNAWEIPAGSSWKRDWSPFCDPEGGSVTIASLGGTSAAEVSIDTERSLWSFSAAVVEGVNLWRFEVKDEQGALRIVSIVAWGMKNEAPVLE